MPRNTAKGAGAGSARAGTAGARAGTKTGTRTAAGSSGRGKSARGAGRTYPRTDLRRLAEEARGATVYLAEKHSIALALADALPGRRENLGACIRCGDVIITWLSGHLLEQAPPEAYDPRFKSWSRATLPIIPQRFELLPRSERGAAEQLEVIRTLLGVCPSAVNAADFDREGQLLVDEVLELAHYQGRVLRLQTRALDVTSLRRELSRMQDNEKFCGMREAARARSQLDWLAGINLTRAMTIHGRSRGADTVLSLGRVQTPTLALVVARDLEIENFVPKPFYKLTCPFAAEAGILPTRLVVDADMKGADSEKRLVDREEALRIQALVSGKPGLVTLVESKRVQEQAPLPYNLTELQKEASARYGIGAQATLQACQRMYEAKFISYPRTDCQYLPVEQFADAPVVLEAVGSFEGMQDMVAACDTTRRSQAWNTARVSAHHAIIPTREPAKGLSERETKVYTLICRRYAWQFLQPHIFTRTRVDVSCEGFLWRANGRVEESAGWTAFRDAGPALAAKRTREDAQAKDVILPQVQRDEKVLAGDVAVEEAMTTPPARFTEGTLVDAMENIQRYIKGASAEDEKILRKTEGLGTVATRAGIIETLFLRSYIKKQGKSLLSTQLGRDVIANSPAVIRDPLMTADMERALSEIQEGRRACADYVASYAATLPTVIEEIFATQASYTPGEARSGSRSTSRSKKSGLGSSESRSESRSGGSSKGRSGQGDGPVCPRCGAHLVLRNGPRGAFWGCSAFPECRFSTDDSNGEPVLEGRGGAAPVRTERSGDTASAARAGSGQGDEPVCPRCGAHLVLRKGSRGAFWGCSAFPACRFTTDDSNGAPVLGGQRGGSPAPSPASGAKIPSPGSGEEVQEQRLCPRCGKPLVLRNSFRGPFWGCSGYPQCRYTEDAGRQADASALQQGRLTGAAAGAERGSGPAPSSASRKDTQHKGMDARTMAPGEQAEAAPLCPRCGKPLVRRNGSRGPFWGCSGYPHCRFSADLSALQGSGQPSPDRESGPRRAMPQAQDRSDMPMPETDAEVLPDFPDDFANIEDMPPMPDDPPWDADTDALYEEWAFRSSKDEEEN